MLTKIEARSNLDNIIANLSNDLINQINDNPKKVHIEYGFIDPSKDDMLYAWYPTLWCTSELGTTSDSCSSRVSPCSPCGRCRSEDDDHSQSDDEVPNPGPKPF